MHRYFRSALIVLGLLLLQTTFVPFLAIGGFVPDLLLVWVVYTAIRRGQTEAMTAGFLVGFLQDVAATQLLGLAALSKTVAGFLGGYFFNENKTDQTLGTSQFLLIVVICSLVHNVIYFVIFLQGAEVSLLWTTAQYTLATTAYTTALSALPMFAFSRKIRS
ncbi:MAG: rod shape-determining protein MreD [Ignavibacteriales bacterium]|nr:rod shape-determining protein MreD [Ignavibacteriales bacterium]